MPRTPEPANDPDGTYSLVTLIPGWLKNQVLEAAVRDGVSVQGWVSAVLVSAVREGRGLPALSSGRRVDVGDVVAAFVSGERVLQPCGRRDCVPVEVVLGGFSFCDVCGVRFI
jgi:hypothetical protein